MNLRQQVDWILKGYYDAIERTPYKRAPAYPEEVLQLCKEQAPAEVGLYWQGWGAGVSDNVRDILKSRGGGQGGR